MTDVEVNAEAIPDELKERDQWLLWDRSNETPRQPHWRGDFSGVSWSDPEDWHTFEEAISAAREVDSWGVGYVTAADNDDHGRGLYGVIDIDGAAEEDDKPRDWLPGLQKLIGEDGAYVEWSPSHTEPGRSGLHVPVWNIDVPGWWSDVNHPDEDHTGVEVLTNKFCTFTGDVEISGGVLEHHDGIEEWLADVYENLTGETAPPRQNKSPNGSDNGRGSSGSSRDEEWLTEDRVEDALDYIDAGCSYEQWRNIGFALADEFDDQTALRLFESWSRGSSKWDEEAERLSERIINDSESGGGVTIGTVVYHAQESGWSPDVSGSGSRQFWKKKVVENSERYDTIEEVPDDPAELPTPDDEIDDESEEEEDEPSEGDVDTEEEDSTGPWAQVRNLYAVAQEESDLTKGRARQAAASVLESMTAWMYVVESERLWVYDEDSGTYNPFGEARAGNVLESALGEFYTRSERAEIVDRVEKRNQVHREELNANEQDDPLLCVGDGVVNLRTGELLEHDPEYRFIRGLGHCYGRDDADRDSILSFLDDVTERKCDRDTLLDHLAHGLMPGHPYRAFVVCYGPGGNGKTQVAELFRGFVGRENAAAVEIDELAGDDFATGDLPGAFINWGDDMAGDGGGSLSDLSTLKKATGGSEIRANEKHEKTFDFKNEAAMFFSANEPPRIGEQKQSIADRIYPIEMPYRFKAPEDVDPDDPLQKEKTPNIAETLLSDDAAMRGLLALAVDHAQQLVENRGEYSQPESPSERLEKYRRTSDPIARFAARALQPADDDMLIRKDDAYRVFRAFAQSWDERAASERGFKRQLPAKFPDEIETAQSRALAMPDDESERVRCWKRVAWTDRAKGQMPDWLRERYAVHFDGDDANPDETAKETDTTDETLPLSPADVTADVATKDNRLPAIEATVSGVYEDRYGNAAGRLEADDGGMDFTLLGDRDRISAGATYRFVGAKLTTDELGGFELEIRPDTEIVVIETPVDDADENDATAAADGGETASTDAGPPDDATDARADMQRVVSLLEDVDTLSKTDVRNRAKQELDMTLGRAGKLLEKAETEGYVEQLDNGDYRKL